MSRFAPALRRVARELDLPRPTRAAILTELAADLESVYEHHLERGAAEAEAARRAEERVLGSPEMARRLSRVHRSSWREWSEEMGGRLTGGLDLLLLLGGVVPVLLFAAAVAVQGVWPGGGSPGASAGPLRWIVLAVATAQAVVVGAEVARVVGDRPVRRARLPLLLVLSALAPALGGLALALGARSALMLVASGAGGDMAMAAARLVVAGSTCVVGLLSGIAGALAWFILLNRAAVQADREVDALLSGEAPPPDARARGILSLVRRRSA
jgi:hypothetical protein